LIYDILLNINIFPSLAHVKRWNIDKHVKRVHVTDTGMLKIDIVAAVKLNFTVTMQAAYENVTAGLASYNATGDNPTSPTVVLTPTRFSNISRDVTDMATFHDAGSFYTCPIIFAMDKIQACEGVKTDTFTQLPNHYIQVILYYFKESRADMC